MVPRYDIFKLSQLGPAEAAGACELDMLWRIPGQVKAHPRNRDVHQELSQEIKRPRRLTGRLVSFLFELQPFLIKMTE